MIYLLAGVSTQVTSQPSSRKTCTQYQQSRPFWLTPRASPTPISPYRTDYRTFENLKTDGTFIYSDDLGSKEGVATIGFTQDGLVITDVLSATGQAYTMDNFMISGKKATQEEYNAEKENQDLKNNVEWHEYPIS